MVLSKLRQGKHKNYSTNIKDMMIIKLERLNKDAGAHKTLKANNEGTQKLFQRHYMKDDHECNEAKYLQKCSKIHQV